MKIPKIRIAGYDGEWKHSFLQDCLLINVSKNKWNKYSKEQVLSVSDELGVVNQIKHLGRSYAGSSVENYKILKPGQIVYTKSPLKEKPYGIIKVNKGDIGIVSILYAVYDTVEGIHPDYIERYFEPNFRINKYLLPLICKGAKNTMNISDENTLKGYINIPDYDEQVDIANYFRLLDSIISKTAKKIEKLKQAKAASLQAMFPQKGETKPRIRFKGFEGDWKSVNLRDISHKVTTKNSNNLYQITLTNSAEHGIINQLDFFDYEVSNNENINGYYVVENDDFVYNPRISVTAPVGPINRNKLGYTGVMSPLYYIFKVHDINKDYLSYFFQTKLWHKFMFDNGNSGARFDRLSIADDVFTLMPIIVPDSKEEQQAMADFFFSLDKQMMLETKRLEKLKRIKTACLNKMFV